MSELTVKTNGMRHIEHETDLCIVGGGLTGLCAAIAAAREGAKVVAVDMAPLTYECEGVEFYQLNVTDSEACVRMNESQAGISNLITKGSDISP